MFTDYNQGYWALVAERIWLVWGYHLSHPSKGMTLLLLYTAKKASAPVLHRIVWESNGNHDCRDLIDLPDPTGLKLLLHTANCQGGKVQATSPFLVVSVCIEPLPPKALLSPFLGGETEAQIHHDLSNIAHMKAVAEQGIEPKSQVSALTARPSFLTHTSVL